MTEFLIIGVGIPAIMVIIFSVIAKSKRCDFLITRKPNNLKTLITAKEIEAVFEMFPQFARRYDYKLNKISKDPHCVILSDGMSVASWGFFYPIYISKQSDGNTQLAIGIKSKFRQDGLDNPIRRSKHESFVKNLKAILEAKV